MKLGIISDTHDHHENVLKATAIFKKHRVETVMHAGDIVSPFTAKAFKDVSVPFIAVYGNNDGEKLFLKQTIETFGGEIHEYGYKDQLAGKSVFMTHVPLQLDAMVKSQQHDLIIYGHTHKVDLRTDGRTTIINPGESTDWITGQGHVVILDTDEMTHQLVPID